ncbi:MAG TPA: hypothetical protein VF748_12260 [Candidatus Acidoferrum sp.]
MPAFPPGPMTSSRLVMASDGTIWQYRPTDPNGMVQVGTGSSDPSDQVVTLGNPIQVNSGAQLPQGQWLLTPHNTSVEIIQSDGTTTVPLAGSTLTDAYPLTVG